METKEIEVRFLEIDKEALIKKLLSLGAKDLGEVMLEEIIIYDKELKWLDERRFIRIRKSGETIKITYKEHRMEAVDGASEIEFEVNDFEKAGFLFEKLGFVQYRRQQKKRHTLEYNDVTFDIDTWPRVPTYVELEGLSEESLKEAAKAVGFDWKNVVVKDARSILENIYKIPMGTMRWLTFDRFE